MNNKIKQIREIKEILGVDILSFTIKFAGMSSEDIEKMEAILYKDNVYIDKEELDTMLSDIINKVKYNRSKITWDITFKDKELKRLNDEKEKLEKVENLNL